jgi:hypothetical protein
MTRRNGVVRSIKLARLAIGRFAGFINQSTIKAPGTGQGATRTNIAETGQIL